MPDLIDWKTSADAIEALKDASIDATELAIGLGLRDTLVAAGESYDLLFTAEAPEDRVFVGATAEQVKEAHAKQSDWDVHATRELKFFDAALREAALDLSYVASPPWPPLPTGSAVPLDTFESLVLRRTPLPPKYTIEDILSIHYTLSVRYSTLTSLPGALGHPFVVSTLLPAGRVHEEFNPHISERPIVPPLGQLVPRRPPPAFPQLTIDARTNALEAALIQAEKFLEMVSLQTP